MGMYTEVFFRAEVDAEAFRAFRLLSQSEIWTGSENFPDHPFFQMDRKCMVMRGSSYYFPQANHLELEIDSYGDYYVSFRSNLKNYDDEIKAFFDWVTPHCKTRGFIGYSLYEEHYIPTLYYAGSEEEFV